MLSTDTQYAETFSSKSYNGVTSDKLTPSFQSQPSSSLTVLITCCFAISIACCPVIISVVSDAPAHSAFNANPENII